MAVRKPAVAPVPSSPRRPRSRRSRHEERGAALFVVVLTITLLTAIGVFAMHQTSQGQVASGYVRRSTAVFYLTEFALNMFASEFAANTDAVEIEGRSGNDQCRSNAPYLQVAAAGTPVFCYARDGAGMQQQIARNYSYVSGSAVAFYGDQSRPDHPADQDIVANVRIELTDRVRVLPPPGTQMNGQLVTQRAVATVMAEHLPTVAGGVCSADATRASDNQAARGYVVYTTANTN